jgi:hypothetical protein
VLGAISQREEESVGIGEQLPRRLPRDASISSEELPSGALHDAQSGSLCVASLMESLCSEAVSASLEYQLGSSLGIVVHPLLEVLLLLLVSDEVRSQQESVHHWLHLLGLLHTQSLELGHECLQLVFVVLAQEDLLDDDLSLAHALHDESGVHREILVLALLQEILDVLDVFHHVLKVAQQYLRVVAYLSSIHSSYLHCMLSMVIVTLVATKLLAASTNKLDLLAFMVSTVHLGNNRSSLAQYLKNGVVEHGVGWSGECGDDAFGVSERAFDQFVVLLDQIFIAFLTASVSTWDECRLLIR